MNHFSKYEYFQELESPVDFGSYEAIGYFPYSTASIHKHVAIPREVFKEIENVLRKYRINDNKIVVVFRDKKHFGAEDFCIYLKDMYAVVGAWEDVTGYGGSKLLLKRENPE